MRKELEVISDIIGNDNRIIKKDVIYKKIFELDEIQVEHFISNRGTVVKKYCTVTVENKFYKMNHPYEYISSLIKPIIVRGFYSKSKKYINGNNNS